MTIEMTPKQKIDIEMCLEPVSGIPCSKVAVGMLWDPYDEHQYPACAWHLSVNHKRAVPLRLRRLGR